MRELALERNPFTNRFGQEAKEFGEFISVLVFFVNAQLVILTEGLAELGEVVLVLI
jgi:hypothetical protein